MAVGILLFVVGIVFAAIVALRPSYEVLFSQLSSQDMTSIANQLTAEGVAYKVDEDGGRILVKKRDVHASRIKVMEAGIPLNQPVGFELFDHAEFGMTEFTQRINYSRALEGELTRTIAALREVERARLHLVLPEGRLFDSEKTQPKAALTLWVRPHMQLSAERISGIQRLIASSVPELQPDAVAIHDDKGASLVAGQTPSPADSINARVDAKRAVESYLANKAQALLDRSFGPSSAIVQIDADLEHDRREIVRDEVLPLRSGQIGAVTGLKSLRGGVFGRPEIVDGEDEYRPAAPVGDVTTEVKYESGRQHETVSVATGAVKRLTVSVLVPRSASEEVRRGISTAVANAVGLNAERGDTVSVIGVPAAAMASPTSGQADIPADEEEHAVPLWWPHDGVALSWLLLAVAVLGGVVGALLQGAVRAPPRMSKEELERFKQDLQTWIDDSTDGEPRAAR